MKRTIALLTSLLLCGALAGCAPDSNRNGTPGSPAPGQPLPAKTGEHYMREF
ncbi:MAG: hypothetical protein ACOYJC_11745 [Christensenellales bacterium]|jgi:hypothetical protein